MRGGLAYHSAVGKPVHTSLNRSANRTEAILQSRDGIRQTSLDVVDRGSLLDRG